MTGNAEGVCPFSREPCVIAGQWATTHEIVASSVGGAAVLGARLGRQVRLFDVSKGIVCPMNGFRGSVEIGDKAPVLTSAAGVAVHIGSTATNPCIELRPWG